MQLDGERLSQVLAVVADLVKLHRERGEAARFAKRRDDERLSAIRPIDAGPNFPGCHRRGRKIGGKLDPYPQGLAPGAPEGHVERAGQSELASGDDTAHRDDVHALPFLPQQPV